MSRQTSTINQPDNAWAGRLKQQLTLLDLSPDVLSDELGIGRATLYRMLSGQLLPRPELWLQMLQQIVLHPRSSLSWNDVLDWDADWAALTFHQQSGDAYLLLRQLFEKIPGTLLARMLQYLSAQPDDRVALPLIRDYQTHRALNQAALQDLQNWLTEQERQAARDEITQLLPEVRQTIAANQDWLTQQQQRLTDTDQFVIQLTQLNEELSTHTGQMLILTNDIAELNAWRTGVDQSINTLDEKVDRSITTLDQKVGRSITTLDEKVDQSITTLDQKIDEVSLAALWRRLWLSTGQRWFGAALEARWQRPIDVIIGLLVLGIIGVFFNWLPMPFRGNPVAQALLVAVLIVIVAWESYREWVARTINAEPPTSAEPPPSLPMASDDRPTESGDSPGE